MNNFDEQILSWIKTEFGDRRVVEMTPAKEAHEWVENVMVPKAPNFCRSAKEEPSVKNVLKRQKNIRTGYPTEYEFNRRINGLDEWKDYQSALNGPDSGHDHVKQLFCTVNVKLVELYEARETPWCDFTVRSFISDNTADVFLVCVKHRDGKKVFAIGEISKFQMKNAPKKAGKNCVCLKDTEPLSQELINLIGDCA